MLMTNTTAPRVLRASTSNTYCVPAALSALTGRHVDDLMPLIREHLGDQPVTGLFYPIAIRILRDMGYTVKELTYGVRHTVAGLAKHLPSNRQYLVLIHGHALVMFNRLVIDNRYPKGITATEYPIRAARVQQVFEVTK